MTKRTVTILLPLLLAIGVSTSTAATPTPGNSVAKYRACLAAHGVTFGASAKRPTAARMKAAFKACATVAPQGGANGRPPNGGPNGRFRNSAAFKKFTACMSKHGVTFSRTKRPDRSSATFKAAQKACASLMPKRPNG